jgi:hypothetical protein
VPRPRNMSVKCAMQANFTETVLYENTRKGKVCKGYR